MFSWLNRLRPTPVSSHRSEPVDGSQAVDAAGPKTAPAAQPPCATDAPVPEGGPVRTRRGGVLSAIVASQSGLTKPKRDDFDDDVSYDAAFLAYQDGGIECRVRTHRVAPDLPRSADSRGGGETGSNLLKWRGSIPAAGGTRGGHSMKKPIPRRAVLKTAGQILLGLAVIAPAADASAQRRRRRPRRPRNRGPRRPQGTGTPELDPTSIASVLALLAAGTMVVVSRARSRDDG